MEIVTEPCMESADEAVTFLEDLRDVFLYLGDKLETNQF